MRLVFCVFWGIACGGSPRHPVEWTSPQDLAAGGGARGPWQQNDSRYDHVDDPSVLLGPDGAAMVAWVDHRTKDVLFQILERDGSTRRASPSNVSRTPLVFSWLPRLAFFDETLHVLWQEIVFSGGAHGGEIFYARSRDAGATFETSRNLSASVAGDGKGRLDAETWSNGSLDLVAGGDGIFAAWTEYEGNLWFARSVDRGETFTAPARVAGDFARPARAPALATSSHSVHLAWTIGEAPDAEVFIATSRDGVIFSPPVILATRGAFSDAPKLAVGADGTVHLVFARSTDGPSGRFEVSYARSRDGGRSFEATRTVSRPHPSGAESAAYPSLAVEGKAVWVFWELYPDHRAAPRGLGYVVSRDGGETFFAPALVPGSIDPAGGGNGSFQGRLMRKVAVRGDEVAVVNSSLLLDRGSRVWLIRGNLARTRSPRSPRRRTGRARRARAARDARPR